jgi:hypothetical protein
VSSLKNNPYLAPNDRYFDTGLDTIKGPAEAAMGPKTSDQNQARYQSRY